MFGVRAERDGNRPNSCGCGSTSEVYWVAVDSYKRLIYSPLASQL